MDKLLLFVQEQGILIMMGMMVLGGLLHQITARRRYRKLCAGIYALSAVQTTGTNVDGGKEGQVERRAEARMENAAEVKSPRRAALRRRALAQGQAGESSGRETLPSEAIPAVQRPTPQTSFTQEQERELDAQLMYLRQSLDRIAAGRDQKLEEESRERRKLTPEQEAVIADILREYLS